MNNIKFYLYLHLSI